MRYKYTIRPVITELKKIARDLDHDLITRERAGELLREYALMLEVQVADNGEQLQLTWNRKPSAAEIRIRETWAKNKEIRSRGPNAG